MVPNLPHLAAITGRDAYRIAAVAAVTILAAAIIAMHLVRDTQLRRARDKAEARYADKANLLERTVANISQGILVIAADNSIDLCNRRLIELLDLPQGLAARHQPLAPLLHWLWMHDEFEDRGGSFETWLAHFLKALRTPAATRSFEHTRPNGVILDVRTVLLPDGGVIRSYTDITDRKLEAQLQHAAQEGAARATEAKSAFLAIMSHEIRSPLSGLLGVLDLLRATPLDPEQSRMAGMIHTSGKLLLAVLNDVLDFSKIEAGALSVTPEPVDLHALLAETVDPHREAARARGIAVTLRIDASVPRLIMTDGMRVAQIAGNLLSNAVKFTAAGSISVTLETASAEAGAPLLRITVHDTGIGMESGTISRLFKPFAQADGSITRKFGGTGLGLCISQQLARLLGGAITVASRPGEGSAFTLTLPCIACAPQAMPPPAPEDPAMIREVGAGLRALLVDDDPTNRWLGQRQLRRLGFTVDVAGDGQAGLAAIRAARYDLLVTDLHMPLLSGVGLTEAIRAGAEHPCHTMPVIGLTADTTDEQRARCLAAGMTELVIKPITAARLEALIARILAKPAADASSAPLAAPAPAAARGLRAIPFDPQIFLEIFAPNDPEGATWLHDYLGAAGQDVAHLAAMLADPARAHAQLADIARIAHRLAGASFSVGATLLGQAARELEHAAESATRPALPPRLAALRAQHEAAERAIEGFLSDAQPFGLHAGLPAA